MSDSSASQGSVDDPTMPGRDAGLVPEKGPLDGLERWVRPDTPPEIAGRLRELQNISHAQFAQVSYSGPLPPASEFAKYEEAMPGSGDRILKMAETEQSLRSQAVEGSLSLGKHRIYAASLISLAVIGLAGVGFYSGYAWQSLPLGFAGIISLFLREILGSRKGRNGSQSKRLPPSEK